MRGGGYTGRKAGLEGEVDSSCPLPLSAERVLRISPLDLSSACAATLPLSLSRPPDSPSRSAGTEAVRDGAAARRPLAVHVGLVVGVDPPAGIRHRVVSVCGTCTAGECWTCPANVFEM